MQKLSFIKGLTIGTLLSAFFWIGAYQLVNSLTDQEIINEEEMETTNIVEVRASF